MNFSAGYFDINVLGLILNKRIYSKMMLGLLLSWYNRCKAMWIYKTLNHLITDSYYLPQNTFQLLRDHFTDWSIKVKRLSFDNFCFCDITLVYQLNVIYQFTWGTHEKLFPFHWGHSIQYWTKENVWKTTFSLLKRPYHVKLLKGCLSQIFTWTIL